MKLFGSILANLGSLAASIGTAGCVFIVYDEPKMPKSLIK